MRIVESTARKRAVKVLCRLQRVICCKKRNLIVQLIILVQKINNLHLIFLRAIRHASHQCQLPQRIDPLLFCKKLLNKIQLFITIIIMARQLTIQHTTFHALFKRHFEYFITCIFVFCSAHLLLHVRNLANNEMVHAAVTAMILKTCEQRKFIISI